MTKATSLKRAGDYSGTPAFTIMLAHDERHLRRKRLITTCGTGIMVDLPEPVVLGEGDALVLADGLLAVIAATIEPLYKITARDPLHYAELCWHLGNRHLSAQITPPAIFIGRDHVIYHMLEGLGARIEEVELPFSPVRGAYHKHGGHAHEHRHE
ncbi:urease accessory protein UreE [Pseudovibrio sp. JE062]|uniref:urease accessory protein UreE n=1 Tax=Pseudovibrio sp. JE062 TaxID=439495 RepID=UPI000186C4CD|nr:urease accessory protein UreE [Pseudovibrio sp. JE062]EEA96561.1 urease accessory protein UreE [Pseudovibrio sp. JE062]